MVKRGYALDAVWKKPHSTWENGKVSSFGAGMKWRVAINAMNGAIVDGVVTKMG
jgi:hypothetical protein